MKEVRWALWRDAPQLEIHVAETIDVEAEAMSGSELVEEAR